MPHAMKTNAKYESHFHTCPHFRLKYDFKESCDSFQSETGFAVNK